MEFMQDFMQEFMHPFSTPRSGAADLIASRIPPGHVSRTLGVVKSTPGGPKKEAPGVKFRPPGAKFRPQGGPRWASGALWGVLGARSARSGRKRGVGKLHEGLLGPSLGPLGVSWARFGSIFPPGRVPEGIFEGFFGTSRPRGKN